MAKMALLIGVSEYESGLNPLPGAVKDVEAIQRVLQHTEMGGFTKENITLLQNPDRQKMEESIEQLFRNRKKEDLVLLFFSGHGMKDDTGKLYLATCKTCKTPQGELVRSTAVAANFVHESMNRSRSKHQVVILDCCFSGAFAEGMSAKDDGTVDIKAQLGGEGRAVLASSTSTQYSFEQKEEDLSIYTHYLIEGIETGAADRDNDGEISVNELHDYVKQKVQEIAPAMNPEIYAVKEGFNIRIAHTLIIDPKQRYRKEVERVAHRGKISEIVRVALDAKQTQLGISVEEARAIEAEVLQPSQRYQRNMQQYEQKFIEAFLRAYPLSSVDRNDLKYLQTVLGLQEEEVQALETQIVTRAKVIGTADMQSPIDRPASQLPLAKPLAQSQSLPVNPSRLPLLKNWQIWSKQRPIWRMSALGLVALVGSYGIFQWSANGEIRNVMQVAAALGNQQNYQGCIQQFQSRSIASLPAEAQSLLGHCQIRQAMLLAKNKQLTEAVQILGQVPAESPVHAKAESLLSYWSDLMLKQAEAQYETGDRDGATRLAKAIPASSSLYQQAQANIFRWSEEWAKNSDHLHMIQTVLKVNDLQTAMTELEKMTTLYWIKQAHQTILAQMTGIIAYEQSIGGDAKKIETAKQLQNTADQLLHSAQATADERTRKATSDPWQLPPDVAEIQDAEGQGPVGFDRPVFPGLPIPLPHFPGFRPELPDWPDDSSILYHEPPAFSPDRPTPTDDPSVPPTIDASENPEIPEEPEIPENPETPAEPPIDPNAPLLQPPSPVDPSAITPPVEPETPTPGLLPPEVPAPDPVAAPVVPNPSEPEPAAAPDPYPDPYPEPITEDPQSVSPPDPPPVSISSDADNLRNSGSFDSGVSDAPGEGSTQTSLSDSSATNWPESSDSSVESLY